jgi:hypothetical protein
MEAMPLAITETGSSDQAGQYWTILGAGPARAGSLWALAAVKSLNGHGIAVSAYLTANLNFKGIAEEIHGQLQQILLSCLRLTRGRREMPLILGASPLPCSKNAQALHQRPAIELAPKLGAIGAHQMAERRAWPARHRRQLGNLRDA